MKKIILLAFLTIGLVSCKSTRIGSTKDAHLKYLDDYVISEDLEVSGTKVGGLSGIDYQDENYYIVSDDPSTPRLYEARIVINNEQIDSVQISKAIKLQLDSILEKAHLDLESILYDKAKEQFIISSEGSINEGKDPMVFMVSKNGKFEDSFNLPENFLAESSKGPRNNGTLEGLTNSHDKKGVWAAMELPLETDGPKPKLIRTKSPVRITYFDKTTGIATKQFPYRLEPIAKIPWMYFAVNGVTDLLEYAPDRFLVLERGFAAGHGSKGNTVRIFDVDASLATNTLDRNNLNVTFYNPAKKTLLYDFKWAKKYLTEEIIDNIEGITFGPVLPNGKQSIILISDNNFNSLGRQLNQVILLEFEPKK